MPEKLHFQPQCVDLVTEFERYIAVVHFSSVRRTGNVEQEENGNNSVTSFFSLPLHLKDILKLVLKGLNDTLLLAYKW